MQFQINQYAFVFDNDKNIITGAHVGFFAPYNSDGESSTNVVLIKATDLPEGQTFFTTSLQDVLAIAKKKLVAALSDAKVGE